MTIIIPYTYSNITIPIGLICNTYLKLYYYNNIQKLFIIKNN